MHLRPFLLAIMAASLAAAVPAWAIPAAGPNDLCPAAANPCIVRRGLDYQVSASQATFNFGTRDVVFEQGAKLATGNGTLSLLLGSLTLEPGAALIAPGGTINVSATRDVMLKRSGNARAKCDVNQQLAPGLITITADGDVTIDGNLESRGLNTEGGGGGVDVIGRSVKVSGEILGSGGTLSDGSIISLSSSDGPVSLTGVVDASGGFGGEITIDAVGGGFTTTASNQASRLDARATGSGGDGGLVEIDADGDISLAVPIRASGAPAGDDFGGYGGEILISTLRSIVIAAAAPFDLNGAVPEGDGGAVTLSALLDIAQNGAITAFGRAPSGAGGSFEAAAGRELKIGKVDVSCVGGSGGEVIASAWCHLEVPAASIIDARGINGTIDFDSGGSVKIRGRVRSSDNSLEIRSDSPAPDLVGALEIAPPFGPPGIDDNLTPCGGFPTPKCGNDLIDADEGEECDDANNESCDGCSSTCKIESCGNGRIDCGEVCDDGDDLPGAPTDECSGDCAGDCKAFFPVCGNDVTECAEQDDDGNTTDCDGVSSSCEIEACGNGVRECDEECDDAANPDCNVALCRLQPVNCGNNVLDPGEECDDDNTDDCDGCSHLCTDEGCGNGIIETCPVGSPVASEQCDDFNTDCLDGCSPTCLAEVCGNGIRDCGEPCDQGAQNGQPGSTCIAVEDGAGELVCQDGEICTPSSEGPCIPCGSPTECDPLNRCGLATCDAGVCVPVSPPDCNDDDACTADSCNPATGCVNENGCNDGDACTDDVCDPNTGCSHTTVVCDDADVCTDESCDPVSGCVRSERSSFAAVSCRLDTLQAILDAATEAELHKKARKKIGLFLKTMRSKLATAQSGVSSGRARKVTKAMKAADKQVDKLGAFVTKQRGRRVGEALAGSLLDAIRDLGVRMRSLAASIVT